MPKFEDFETFYAWYKSLNPTEEVDMAEALTIFHYQDTYML